MYSIHIEDGLDFSRYEKRGFFTEIFAAVSGKDKIRLESNILPAATGTMTYIALLRKNDGLWDVLEKHTHLSAAARDGLPSFQENVKRVSSGLTRKEAQDYLSGKNRHAAQLWAEKEEKRNNIALAKKILP